MSGRDGINVAHLGDDAMVLLTDPKLHFDFLSPGEAFVLLRDLSGVAIRRVAEAVAKVLDTKHAMELEMGGQVTTVETKGRSVVFSQAGRQLSMSRARAREVWRQCESVANNMTLTS